MLRGFFKVCFFSSLAAPALSQDVDTIRINEFVAALEAHGCLLHQTDAQGFVLANGFPDARETQSIIASLIEAGNARTDGPSLILETANCGSSATSVLPAPQPATVPQLVGSLPMCPSDALNLNADTACNCAPSHSTGTVWGTGIYTADSNVCTAARHSGALAANGGDINVVLGGRLEAFAGSTQNGVTTYDWGGYDRSFSIVVLQPPTPGPRPVPTSAASCPSFEQPGQIYQLTGDQMYAPQVLSLQAGGTHDISGCNVGGVGYAAEVPHFSINLSAMEGYGRLEIEVEGQCDTTLLVNTPTAQWVFDDDSGGDLQPVMNLPSSAALNGRLDIWVGTFDGTACPATIELETWHG